MQKVNVLGTEYTIAFRDEKDDPKLDGCDGYTDASTHMIVIDKHSEPDVMDCDDMQAVIRLVMRHELIHAFANESGLAACSEWAQNEEMVDWVAHQFPKMLKAFREAGALE